MLNRVCTIGRMTRDPELRRTGNGTAVTSFTLAINRSFQSTDGQQADFIPCVVWNKIAENVERYCSKGALVGVEGRLRSRSYDNSQGQKVFVVEVVCDSVQFLETRSTSESDYTSHTSVFDENLNKYPSQQQNALHNDFNDVSDTFNYGITADDIQF